MNGIPEPFRHLLQDAIKNAFLLIFFLLMLLLLVGFVECWIRRNQIGE